MDYRQRPYDQLRQLAEEFLAQHHASGTIPVPIETIVEFKLGLEVIPVPGLHDEFEVDGFLALGRKGIYVDEWVMLERLGRYRFTLAYEAARFLLQEAICPKSIKTIPDFVKWQADRNCPANHTSMDDRSRGAATAWTRAFAFHMRTGDRSLRSRGRAQHRRGTRSGR
jgi:hypothetical protein